MKILFLDQYSDLGGAQRCLLDLLPAIRERGWTAHVAAPGNGALLHAAAAQGADVDSIACGPYSSGHKSAAELLRFARETPRLASQIRDLAERAQADLLYGNGPRLLPAAAWAARDRRPLLFHCHSHLPKRYAAWLAGRALRSARATVVACCRFAAEPLLPRLRPGQLRVVYNGVAEGPPRKPSASSDGCRRIGVIGRVAPEKGQAEFLRAARLLAPALPRYRFVICGDALFSDPAAQEYRALLGQLAAGLPVEFLGWRDDVCAVLASLDLLVVPSVQEPATTRVILEAYASGVPVVAFPSGGIPEVVVDGETGVLVDPPTPEALAARVHCLLEEQPGQLRRVAEAGYTLWRERFTLERYRREMLDAIEAAAGSR
ncbi:MAG TPA: glycosyltransferase family 4 protein [Bryobacterales bacterium]|nr:glycosyltransferase family 4 protein [Bryobacterales bacterium]